jgi:hypothetical protein
MSKKKNGEARNELYQCIEIPLVPNLNSGLQILSRGREVVGEDQLIVPLVLFHLILFSLKKIVSTPLMLC